jgi:tetratricopeptide (TPR) repeat protein
MCSGWRVLAGTVVCFAWLLATAQEGHVHPAPERLGTVTFPVSCKPEVQAEFNRGVALLHSFAYTTAEDAFRIVEAHDPGCAMAHWGVAMSRFHQLWEPPFEAGAVAVGQQEIAEAQRIGARTDRERGFVHAAALVFAGADKIPYATRSGNYELAMADLAAANKKDVEVQAFYALALVSNALPSDKTHAKQKQAVEILEPLFREYPQHPGIPHYLIHAYDNAELAPQGLAAAKVYSQIAPSAPHALHMPSHIFTRLGLWENSIASNTAARKAAHDLRDAGEELHAMDYLVYAYLQLGREKEAAQVIAELKVMQNLTMSDFKVGYAATAMPIRYIIERGQWAAAAAVVPPRDAPPHVVAIAVWARGIGLARTSRPEEARQAAKSLHTIQQQLAQVGNVYWATQVEILKREVEAWTSQAQGEPQDAASALRVAADEEEAVEKLPVTPGPIIPAREQLGDLLLQQGHPDLARKEFQTALANSPARAGALCGMSEASAILIEYKAKH